MSKIFDQFYCYVMTLAREGHFVEKGEEKRRIKTEQRRVRFYRLRSDEREREVDPEAHHSRIEKQL